VYSAQHLCDGNPAADVPLTRAGEEQAAKMGRELKDVEIDLCVTSQFLRTKQTADIALAGRDIPRLVEARLNDFNYGMFQDRPKDDFHAWCKDKGMIASIPGGESHYQMVTRCVAALRDIEKRPEQAVLVATHSLVVSYVLYAGQGIEPVPEEPKIPYATPYLLTKEEADSAFSFLEQWLERQKAT
jgi:probable phosphoglycerate mutase